MHSSPRLPYCYPGWTEVEVPVVHGFQPGFAKRVREASALHSAALQERHRRTAAWTLRQGWPISFLPGAW